MGVADAAQDGPLIEALPLLYKMRPALNRPAARFTKTCLATLLTHVQAQLSALDDQFQSKQLAEADKYEELSREKEALNESWDEQNRQLLAQHEQLLEEVTTDFTAKQQACKWP